MRTHSHPQVHARWRGCRRTLLSLAVGALAMPAMAAQTPARTVTAPARALTPVYPTAP